MSSHLASEPSSAASTPRSEHHLPPPPHRWHHQSQQRDGGSNDEEDVPGPRVRLMCSFGGRIVPRPHDHELRYVGGETRIVAIPRAASFSALLAKLAKLLPVGAGARGLQVKYQLPNEDLDALISVTSDEDVEIMMEEHERLAAISGGTAARSPRLRLFLFPTSGGSTGGGFDSLHVGVDDPGARRERWFLDALNNRAVAAARLERGRSEVSSIVSEAPDYLFSLDSNSEQAEPIQRRPHDHRHEQIQSTPGSLDSAVRQTPLEPPELPIPDLPPLKTAKPLPAINQEIPMDELGQQGATGGGYPGSQAWHYVTEPVPVYLVPASVPQQHAASPVPIPLHVSYSSQAGNHGQLPVVYQRPVQGYSSTTMTAGGPVFVGGLPLAGAAPVGPYGLPTMVHGPLGAGPGMMVSVNPTPGVISKADLADAVGFNKGDQSISM